MITVPGADGYDVILDGGSDARVCCADVTVCCADDDGVRRR